MDGLRNYETATLRLGICLALPKRMHDRVRELTALHVPEADRRKGYARELMERVTAEADEAGITLLLQPRGDGDMSDGQLAQWYARRFGFAAIQAKPLLMARMPGSTPRYLRPLAAAAAVAIGRAKEVTPA